FAGKDVCSIVLEVPNSALGPKEVALWARTLDSAGGGWVQADRGAQPAQSVLLSSAERDAYLAGEPSNGPAPRRARRRIVERPKALQFMPCAAHVPRFQNQILGKLALQIQGVLEDIRSAPVLHVGQNIGSVDCGLRPSD